MKAKAITLTLYECSHCGNKYMLEKDADECCPMPRFRKSKEEKARQAEQMGWEECHLVHAYCPASNRERRMLDEEIAFKDKMYADLIAKGISLEFVKEHVDEKMIWRWMMDHTEIKKV